MLQSTFIKLCSSYSDDKAQVENLWTELMKHYQERGRHYHTLLHLENMLTQLSEVKTNITDWDTILFSLYYHDVIYNSIKANNEEKSAMLAEKRMKELAVPVSMLNQSKAQILATKTHQLSNDADCNYFTDADLSVLGASQEVYKQYHENVRKEYSIYPDLIYKPGRRKVLRHFLEMDRIFKTEFFHDKYEAQAKQNLEMELALVSK